MLQDPQQVYDTMHQKCLLIEGGSTDPLTGITCLITLEGWGTKSTMVSETLIYQGVK